MPEGYDTHADFMEWVRNDSSARASSIRESLLIAFSRYVQVKEVEFIDFASMSVIDLASAIRSHPAVLKPLMSCCNIAGRAVERDLGIRGLDTYSPRLTDQHAAAIAGYLKPFLPPAIAIPALSELDRFFFVDKEIRARKGRWEQAILNALNEHSKLVFKKRRFEVNGESFELDAAAPVQGSIQVAIDIKRIEARRDIHKRADEIINKATKFKVSHRDGVFAAVLYYPFPTEQINVQSRLKSKQIDAVSFATQSPEQIRVAIGLLIDQLGIRRE